MLPATTTKASDFSEAFCLDYLEVLFIHERDACATKDFLQHIFFYL